MDTNRKLIIKTLAACAILTNAISILGSNMPTEEATLEAQSLVLRLETLKFEREALLEKLETELTKGTVHTLKSLDLSKLVPKSIEEISAIDDLTRNKIIELIQKVLNQYLQNDTLHTLERLPTSITLGYLLTPSEESAFIQKAFDKYSGKLYMLNNTYSLSQTLFKENAQLHITFIKKIFNRYQANGMLHRFNDLNLFFSVLSNEDPLTRMLPYEGWENYYTVTNFLEKIEKNTSGINTFSENNPIIAEKIRKQLHMWYIRKNIENLCSPFEKIKIPVDFFTPELLAPLSPQDISAIIESLCSNHSIIITMEQWQPLCQSFLMHNTLPDELPFEQFTDLFDPFYQGKQACVSGTPAKIQELYESYELDETRSELIFVRRN